MVSLFVCLFVCLLVCFAVGLRIGVVSLLQLISCLVGGPCMCLLNCVCDFGGFVRVCDVLACWLFGWSRVSLFSYICVG